MRRAWLALAIVPADAASWCSARHCVGHQSRLPFNPFRKTNAPDKAGAAVRLYALMTWQKIRTKSR